MSTRVNSMSMTEAAAMLIEAQTGEKRAALEKIIARLETARAAADLIVGALAGHASIL